MFFVYVVGLFGSFGFGVPCRLWDENFVVPSGVES